MIDDPFRAHVLRHRHLQIATGCVAAATTFALKHSTALFRGERGMHFRRRLMGLPGLAAEDGCSICI